MYVIDFKCRMQALIFFVDGVAVSVTVSVVSDPRVCNLRGASASFDEACEKSNNKRSQH